ncbi:hypothetical protein Poly41_67470 [Novipirellula artificiosorum]|uniref:Uncharacterized protein n=1 Tax=Novipirellula artificiosorum TaxID=2528016 RepID=A0A5C6CX88_9BACT|nr:hypothetical protein Poly41_67470 [Novipirellula artificiosorum]
MDQHSLATFPFPKFLDQTVIETAYLEDRHKISIHFGELAEEAVNFSGRVLACRRNTVSPSSLRTQTVICLACWSMATYNITGFSWWFGEANGYAVFRFSKQNQENLFC